MDDQLTYLFISLYGTDYLSDFLIVRCPLTFVTVT